MLRELALSGVPGSLSRSDVYFGQLPCGEAAMSVASWLYPDALGWKSPDPAGSPLSPLTYAVLCPEASVRQSAWPANAYRSSWRANVAALPGTMNWLTAWAMTLSRCWDS